MGCRIALQKRNHERKGKIAGRNSHSHMVQGGPGNGLRTGPALNWGGKWKL